MVLFKNPRDASQFGNLARQMYPKLAIADHQEVVEKEASNFAEGRISVRLAASATDGARLSASEIMQAAKKLVLVDEFDREYKRLQKSADAAAKTNSSLHLSTLQSQSLRRPESETVAYVAALHKYINTRAELMGGLLKPIYSDTTQLNSTRRRVELSCVAINGFLHSIQRGGASAGCGPAHSPHRCTKCNSPPISGQCTNFILFKWHYKCP